MNPLRSDVYRQYDTAIFKSLSMPGESVLSLRAEFFNVLNSTTFWLPNNTVDAATGGKVTAASNALREIQGALKYNF